LLPTADLIVFRLFDEACPRLEPGRVATGESGSSNSKLLSADKVRELDGLLQKVDLVTILETRAEYTLNLERIAAAGT
jgi:hypothetical protein